MDWIHYKKAILLFFSYFWKVTTVFATFCSVYGACFSKYLEYWKEYVIITLLSATFISLILLVNHLIKKGTTDYTNDSIPEQLLKILSEISTEAFDTLIDGIDRYFHLSCYDEHRIKLGTLIEQKYKNIKTDKYFEKIYNKYSIENLVDRLGWASYLGKKDINIVISNISHGVTMAHDNGYFYYAAKGERHLASIELNRNNMTTFLQHLDKSKIYTKKIQDKKEKTEMKASLLLLEAKYLLKQGSLSCAEDKAKEAERLFSNDPRRQLKVYAVLGQIYYVQKEWGKAHRMYMSGYTKSKDIRKDERRKNASGLAMLYSNKNAKEFYNENKAKEFREEVKTLETPLETHNNSHWCQNKFLKFFK